MTCSVTDVSSALGLTACMGVQQLRASSVGAAETVPMLHHAIGRMLYATSKAPWHGS